jgi:hypothetical protein
LSHLGPLYLENSKILSTIEIKSQLSLLDR